MVCQNMDTSIVNLSRRSTLKIIAYDQSGNGETGTGFFVKIGNTILVITNLHVIVRTTIIENRPRTTTLENIRGITYYGDTIKLVFKSSKEGIIPDDYVRYDYATLIGNIPSSMSALDLSFDNKLFYVGQKIYFSGYPIDCPLLTHSGVISGFTNDSVAIYIEASINSGNSGGALINDKGKVVGIVTFKQTFNFNNDLNKLKNSGSSVAIGVNDKDGNKMNLAGTDFNINLYQILNKYLNTGIGGAINIKFLRKTLYNK